MKIIKKFAKMKGKILDVGCHDGTLHNDLIKEYSEHNVWGLDIILKKETDRLFEGSAEQMPFNNNFFDIIIAGELIEHLEKPKKFIKECKRVLKSNGIVIITTPNVKSLVNRIFKNYHHGGHISLFDEQTLKNIFEKQDFKVIHFSHLPFTKYSSPGRSAEFGNFKNFIKNIGRVLSHYLLPDKFKEDMVLVAIRSSRKKAEP